MKKLGMLVCAAVLGFAAMGSVYADADDVAWIKKCVSDNKDEGQTSAVVEAYCTCMNNKMSSSETKSITSWEKTHKAEADACGKQAGWVNK